MNKAPNQKNNNAANMLPKQCISVAGITARIQVRLWSGGVTREKSGISVTDNIIIIYSSRNTVSRKVRQ